MQAFQTDSLLNMQTVSRNTWLWMDGSYMVTRSRLGVSLELDALKV